MTNPAGAQIVNAVGPIRQIIDPAAQANEEHRYLAVFSVESGKLGRPVQQPRRRLWLAPTAAFTRGFGGSHSE